MPSIDLASALERRAATLQQRLRAKVEANLSGDILQSRTGALKASILSTLAANTDEIEVELASVGVGYAAIQEHGGTTPAHDIVPVKARALAYAGGVFARAHHPGSTIPARAPLGSALDSLREEIAGGLKDAIRAALGAI